MVLLLTLALLGGTALPPFPGPGPEPEATLPTFRARDLHGERHTVPDQTGLDQTLLVVAHDRHPAEEVVAWLEAAERYLPPGTRTELVLSTEAEEHARALIPDRFWGETLVDRGGRIASELGLVEDRWPQVYALDEVGRVLVGYHGRADDPAARRVFRALAPYARPAWPLW